MLCVPHNFVKSSHLSSTSCFSSGLLQMSLSCSEAQPIGLAERSMLVAPLNTFTWNSSCKHAAGTAHNTEIHDTGIA
jgi:hypothetical protein